jgi:hypothetical protein
LEIGKPEIRYVQAKDMEKVKQVEEIAKTKVVVFSMFGGSWAKNSKELAVAFSKESNFNVSLVASYEQYREIQDHIEA